MKHLFIFLCFLLASCSNPNEDALNELIVLRGTVVGIPYFVKGGGQASTIGIDLQSPIQVNGFQKPMTRVVLLIPMKQLRAWGPDVIGKTIVVTCSHNALVPWGSKNVACSPQNIELGP